MKFFEHGQKRLLSLLLTLVLLVSLVPVISLPASAENENINSISISDPRFYNDGSLKSMKISFVVCHSESDGLGVAYGKFAVHSGPPTTQWDYFNPYKSGDNQTWPNLTGADNSIVAVSGNSFRWTENQGNRTETVEFNEGKVTSGPVYNLYMWSLSVSGYSTGAYPDCFFAKIKIENGELKVVYSQDESFPTVHTHQWKSDPIDGNGTKEASTTIFCADMACGEGVEVSLTASDVTLPGNVFSAQISVEKVERPAVAFALRTARQAPAGLPEGLTEGLTISEPVYKYSATGSGYEPIDPASFTPKAGYYQAAVQITDDYNNNSTVAELAVKYTVSDPAVTAATGDNRPIELLAMGMALFSVLAIAAFLLDDRRKAR